jgi:hypothetical protein
MPHIDRGEEVGDNVASGLAPKLPFAMNPDTDVDGSRSRRPRTSMVCLLRATAATMIPWVLIIATEALFPNSYLCSLL